MSVGSRGIDMAVEAFKEMNEEDRSKAPEAYASGSASDAIPNELAAIRRALERIADRLDGWSSHSGGYLEVRTRAE